MSPAEILLAQGIVAAIGYLFLVRQSPSWGRSLVKTAALGQTGFALYVAGAGPLPLIALALSVFGDFSLSRNGDRWFLLGLSGFLLAHLCYAWLFAMQFALDEMRWPLFIGLLALVISTRNWLLPRAGEMMRPVAAYIAAITLMAALALGLPEWEWMIVAGALLFVASDVALAVQLFVWPMSAILPYVVWPLYVAGQIMIQFGLLL